MAGMKSLTFLLSGCCIGFLVLLIYGRILFASADVPLYPWASDTLGHVLKAEYLQDKLAEGDLYPDLFPGWYMGLQMLRYHPPLPYYLLAGLAALTGSSMAAANWLIALCALTGGMSWLLYQRWLGWLPALAGGALYLFLPDHVRVAFAEGNLPRVVATAVLPLAVYFLLCCLEETGTRRQRLGLVLSFTVIVLSHAMMAAIYAVCCLLLAVLYGFGQRMALRRVLLAGVSMGLGIMLAGWWVLPSLTGGITEINTAAMTEALAVFPLTHYVTPKLHASDQESIYIGVALLLLAVVFLFIRAGRNRYTVAVTLTGLFGVLITTPFPNKLFNALPLHSLLWPLRFLGIASFLLLLGVMWRLQPWLARLPFLPLAIVALLALDGATSIRLIHLRPVDRDFTAIRALLMSLPGWREATLDQSRLGSTASYFFAAQGRREQIFGWAYQGARTATSVAALNEAMELGAVSYVRDRLTLLGADDVVLLQGMFFTSRVEAELVSAGWRPVYHGSRATLYHRDGSPRAYRIPWRVLGIGRGTQNLAYRFPQLVVGTSPYVDDYSLEELKRYETLVLSGFNWHNREVAEALIVQAAGSGVHVVVDLTGAPEDPLARIPHFLNVWGERIILDDRPVVAQGEGRRYALVPFGSQMELWYTHTPQGVQTEVLNFDYLGETTTMLGYNRYGSGQVWFVGLNLPYHAAITGDQTAINLLADLLRLPPDTPATYSAVPLSNYTADQRGYSFSYLLEQPDRLVVPLAHHAGMVVTVDGVPVQLSSFEQLVAFEAPAGAHTVEIRLHPTPIYLFGRLASGLALVGLLLLLAWETRFLKRTSSGQRLGAIDPYAVDDTGLPACLTESLKERV